MHNVNRNSDGIGSNSPYYNYLLFRATAARCSTCEPRMPAQRSIRARRRPARRPIRRTTSPTSTPSSSAANTAFDFGLTVDACARICSATFPQDMEFQNERQRIGTWLALEQDSDHGRADQIAVGWAHAGATPGDPAGQHNYNPVQRTATTRPICTRFAWQAQARQAIDWYFDAAETINDGNAHYDIGAGGHGIKTDCHDGTNTVFIDYSSAGPTTWGGCHPVGISTGVNYKF